MQDEILYMKNKSKAGKMEKLIETLLSKNIAEATNAVDIRIMNHPETSTTKFQNVSASILMTLKNLDDEEQPARKQKIGSKEVEEMIMGK